MTDLRALLNNATPPPWTLNAGDPRWGGEIGPQGVYTGEDREFGAADAALIVALVNQAHTLLDIAEAAREYVASYGNEPFSPSSTKLRAALAKLDAP